MRSRPKKSTPIAHPSTDTKKNTTLPHTLPPTDAVLTHSHLPTTHTIQYLSVVEPIFELVRVALAVSTFLLKHLFYLVFPFSFLTLSHLCAHHVTIKAFLTSQSSQEKIHRTSPSCQFRVASLLSSLSEGIRLMWSKSFFRRRSNVFSAAESSD